ncbi:amidohydrolase [Halocalculus aciditolerans]|uniref:Amidohydrolase n=1 Tax=Halocalculus aciditolerans TaxID=1383812 RepID=A0A830F839_9EURY|nr:amidohydrolase [Halocalculus aciditolerans]GGL49733.1 amidohydrolase [Halocalculus aciditolerans]
MTAPADRVFLDGEVHTLGTPDKTYEAVAVRDGRVVRLADTYEVEFLVGAETEVIDLDGRVLLPGFVDAHVHMTTVGQHAVHADLRGAESLDDALARLRERARHADEWILGYGFDESTWPDGRILTSDDLDGVSTDRPVVAFREDLHTAAVNSVVLDEYGNEMPDADVRENGVIVEDAVNVVTERVEPNRTEARELLREAQREAHSRGITAVHDMVRKSRAPAAYRALDAAGDLRLRVRLNYWADHLDAVRELGLATNWGSENLRVGAIKSFTDGSLGGHTAKLSFDYADADGERGTWVVDPEELDEIVQEADRQGLQVTAHAIGDEAVDAVLDAYEATENPGKSRHRIEHAELASDDAIERMADLGVVASMQPNFLKWSHPGGLYDDRIGAERRDTHNRYPAYLDAGVPLAFGSDSMPLDPLLGVHEATHPPEETQELSVTEALRAYTSGAAYAGFDEDRMGTIEEGYLADFVALDRSPWDVDDIEHVPVAFTVVDGDIVYDAR